MADKRLFLGDGDRYALDGISYESCANQKALSRCIRNCVGGLAALCCSAQFSSHDACSYFAGRRQWNLDRNGASDPLIDLSDQSHRCGDGLVWTLNYRGTRDRTDDRWADRGPLELACDILYRCRDRFDLVDLGHKGF